MWALVAAEMLTNFKIGCIHKKHPSLFSLFCFCLFPFLFPFPFPFSSFIGYNSGWEGPQQVCGSTSCSQQFTSEVRLGSSGLLAVRVKKNLRKRRLHSHSAFIRKRFPLYLGWSYSMFQAMTVVPCLPALHHCEEPASSLFLIFPQALGAAVR